MGSRLAMNLDKYPNLNIFSRSLGLQFPYFSGVIQRQADNFGDEWLNLFECELHHFFSLDEERIEQAVKGYGKFSLDSMKLQVQFQKTKSYQNKTYAEAASEVYQNKEYMFDLYLPGILISHYLWKHHFQQHVFFVKKSRSPIQNQ